MDNIETYEQRGDLSKILEQLDNERIHESQTDMAPTNFAGVAILAFVKGTLTLTVNS